jgi:hypothetical protein
MEIMVPAAELVPDDVVKLSLAGIVATVKPIRFRQTAVDAQNRGCEGLRGPKTGRA